MPEPFRQLAPEVWAAHRQIDQAIFALMGLRGLLLSGGDTIECRPSELHELIQPIIDKLRAGAIALAIIDEDGMPGSR